MSADILTRAEVASMESKPTTEWEARLAATCLALYESLDAADRDYDRIEAEREDADDAMLAAREERDKAESWGTRQQARAHAAEKREARLRGLLGEVRDHPATALSERLHRRITAALDGDKGGR